MSFDIDNTGRYLITGDQVNSIIILFGKLVDISNETNFFFFVCDLVWEINGLRFNSKS